MTGKREERGSGGKFIMKSVGSIFIAALVGAVFAGLGFLYFNAPPAEAQKKFALQWEYAAVTFAHNPFATERQAVINGAAIVCYLKENGCQNEEINVEVVYTKFLQEMRLEDKVSAKEAAYNRARDLAFSKAVAKLGSEGWEIIAAPSFEFDNYVPNYEGTISIAQGEKRIAPDVYFKRLKQF